ncbi:hypothetical protein DPB93_18720 [Salmonella enterica subsp. salamae]|nr:hypothetical protein [Salmonella enterica subsp. salamae]ECH9260201.1 hypothetical protein [Salmonella enterica subsp. enterica]EEO2382657.1 hypothetical protein [Salmonella enterica]ECI4077645.1 hypothetical protein [Salmonella enterica subsp. salamae]EDW9585758.1 hypothetical protein [Salmonella enterica subsp. enterica]
MEWVTHIITFLTGLGAGWTLRVVYTSRKTAIEIKSNDNNYSVSQNRNKVSNGSIVGRDQSNSPH